MKKEKFSSGGITGGSSLLIIFAVLCIAVFAILSLSDSLASGRLENASANSVINYYSADYQAEEILSELRTGAVPDNVEKDGNIYTYRCPISDTSAIEVQVELAGSDYTVLKWQQIYTADWQAEQKLEVWEREGS